MGTFLHIEELKKSWKRETCRLLRPPRSRRRSPPRRRARRSPSRRASILMTNCWKKWLDLTINSEMKDILESPEKYLNTLLKYYNLLEVNLETNLKLTSEEMKSFQTLEKHNTFLQLFHQLELLNL